MFAPETTKPPTLPYPTPTARHVEVDGHATESKEATGAGAVSLVQVLPPSVVETMSLLPTAVQSKAD
ncbi:MAG: hypothetical protein M1134_01140 [Actinobacteria bacterium]|nr:hypothetical protein [Actinomycetota bacterium]